MLHTITKLLKICIDTNIAISNISNNYRGEGGEGTLRRDQQLIREQHRKTRGISTLLM